MTTVGMGRASIFCETYTIGLLYLSNVGAEPLCTYEALLSPPRFRGLVRYLILRYVKKIS